MLTLRKKNGLSLAAKSAASLFEIPLWSGYPRKSHIV